MRRILPIVVLTIAGCGSNDPAGDNPPPPPSQSQDGGVTAQRDAATNTQNDASTTQNDASVAMDAAPIEPGALGCRNVSIRTGEDGDGEQNSVFYTTAFNSPDTDLSEFIDAKGWKTGGALVLCAGVLANDGKAPLTLQADVTVAISLPLDNCLCRSYLSVGSVGSLYCKPHVDAVDFKLTVDSQGDGAAGPVQVVTGPTAAMGEGDVRITFQTKAANIQAAANDCTPAACSGALGAETANPPDYTTREAVSEVTNARQGGTIDIRASGSPFDDDPSDGTADCEDWTNTAIHGSLAGAPGFDFDNTSVGSAKDVVTIERIAE
jgi:hypothetical protein